MPLASPRMSTLSRALFSVAAVSTVTAAIMLGACQGTTAIMLDLRTNVPCTGLAPWQGVAVYVGSPGLDVETKAPATTACDASGMIGTLAVVPNAGRDAAVGIRVVAGITRKPEDCAAAGYDGCIVARRSLSFVPHQELDLLIELTLDCAGNACDALHSCVNGACSEARLTTPIAAADAAAPGTVRCGESGLECPTEGNVCCLSIADAGTATGQCKPSTQCPADSIVLACDKASDCAGSDDAGNPRVCCLGYVPGPGGFHLPAVVAASECITASACGKTGPALGSARLLCEDRAPCVNPGTPDLLQCIQSNAALPGYFWCEANT